MPGPGHVLPLPSPLPSPSLVPPLPLRAPVTILLLQSNAGCASVARLALVAQITRSFSAEVRQNLGIPAMRLAYSNALVVNTAPLPPPRNLGRFLMSCIANRLSHVKVKKYCSQPSLQKTIKSTTRAAKKEQAAQGILWRGGKKLFY